MTPLGLQPLRGLVDPANQRAGGVDQLLAGRLQPTSLGVADPVRGDQDQRGRWQGLAVPLGRLPEARLVQPSADLRVMNEFAVDRDPSGVRIASVIFKASLTPKHIPISSARMTFTIV